MCLTLALPAEFATLTTNVWRPRPTPLRVSGDVHGVAAAPSSEHVTLVGEPVVVQAKVGELDAERGTSVNVTVGRTAAGAEAVTVQAYDALFEPPLLATLTTKLWLPTARPL
jgi:hypothetical protein